MSLSSLLVAVALVATAASAQAAPAQAPARTRAKPTAAEAKKSPADAQAPYRLYRKVWEMVRENYYDPTYNEQDWSRWQNRYDGKLKTMDDSHKAIETMLASLGDRYTRFLDNKAFEDETEQIQARLYGIGVQIGFDKTQKIVVIAPIEGTPASKAGLMPGDEIAGINGKPTKGMSLEEASKNIRGPVGTQVDLTVLRGGEEKQFKITRAEIPIRSVHMVKMLTEDIGYIRLGTFISQNANQEVRDALAKLTPARGIILDLRGNPGGLLTNAVDISSMFLEGGVVVSTVDRNNRPVHARSTGRPISRHPLVVLIDQGSASASEITSGALKDSGRAILVGQKSFGKGLVQSVNRLEDGSGVNLTIARYVTPNNIDIHKKGILPDYEVELKAEDYKEGRGPWWLDPGGPTVKRSPEDLKDVQLKKAVEVLENKLAKTASPYEIKLNFPGFGPTPMSGSPLGVQP